MLGRTRRFLPLFALTLDLACCNVARGGPAQDMLGVYFDIDATVFHDSTSAPLEQVNAYLFLRNPSGLDGVFGWFGDVRVEGPHVLLSWTPNHPCVAIDCCGLGGWPPFACFYTSAVTWEPAVLLASAWIMVTSPDSQVSFFVGPNLDFPHAHPQYLAGPDYPADLVVMRPVSGSYDKPVATINGEPPVDRPGSTWGAVKGLYR